MGPLLAWESGALVLAVTLAIVPAVVSAAATQLRDAQQAVSLPRGSRIQSEAGAEAYARAVEAVLPAAVAKVEAAQGGTFLQPIHISVYVTAEAYARDTGFGNGSARAVMYLGRIMLSPQLWAQAQSSPHSLALILTHELSHLHFYDHRGMVAYVGIPNWFLEGMAVMVSGGGGAERVAPQVARSAIAAGHMIRISDATGLFGNGFDEPPSANIVRGDQQYIYHMYYRQAGLFLEYLQATNPSGFVQLVRSLRDGHDFLASFRQALGTTPKQAWTAFAATTRVQQPRT